MWKYLVVDLSGLFLSRDSVFRSVGWDPVPSFSPSAVRKMGKATSFYRRYDRHRNITICNGCIHIFSNVDIMLWGIKFSAAPYAVIVQRIHLRKKRCCLLCYHYHVLRSVIIIVGRRCLY